MAWRLVIMSLLITACATRYPLMIDREIAGEVYETRIIETLEERKVLDYYRYAVLTRTPAGYYEFEVVCSYPLPEGVKLHFCFDSTEVNEPRRGDIKQVRYLYKQKKRK
jgi:hypothetical protein